MKVSDKKKLGKIEQIRVSASNPISYGFTPQTEDAEIVAVRASVRTQNISVSGGECKVSACALFTVVLKGDDGFCQEENTVAFDVVFKNDRIADDRPINVCYSVGDVKYSLNGEEYVISAIIDSEADFYVATEQEYVCGQEGATVKTEEIETLVRIADFGSVFDSDGDKEFSFEIAAMLCHEERVRVKSVACGIDHVSISGEIIAEFLFVTPRGEFSRESLTVPFTTEAECENCTPDDFAVAFTEVQAANYRVENDGEKKRSVLSGEFTLGFYINVFRSETHTIIVDAFSAREELLLGKGELGYVCGAGNRELNYKCFGEAASDKGEGHAVCVLGGEVYAFDYVKEGAKFNLNGVVRADILVRDKDETLRKAYAELPFACSFDYDGEPAAVACNPLKINAKDLDGKCVLECELAIGTQYVRYAATVAVTEIEAGEERKPDDCAVRIVFVEKGDDAWTVCKKACISQDELFKLNSELNFPAEKDSGIVVYRKLGAF